MKCMTCNECLDKQICAKYNGYDKAPYPLVEYKNKLCVENIELLCEEKRKSMKGLNDWEEVNDVTGITVYCKKVNGYNREVYYNNKIHKWCFKIWNSRSSFPIVGSARTFNEAIEKCEKEQ